MSMTLGNVNDASTFGNITNDGDYDFQSFVNSTPLPIEEDPPKTTTIPAKASAAEVPAATATTSGGLSTFKAATFELKVAPSATTDFTRFDTKMQSAFSSPVGGMNFMQQTEILPFQVQTMVQNSGDFLCSKSAARQSIGLSGPGSRAMMAASSSIVNNSTFSSTSSLLSIPTSNNMPYDIFGIGLLVLTFPLLPYPVFLDWHLMPPLPPSNDSGIVDQQVKNNPSISEEEELKGKKSNEKLAKDGAVSILLSNLKAAHIDAETIALLVKVYNTLSQNNKEQMMKELTTTVFSAQITERQTKAKVLARHYSQNAINDNIAKGKGEHEDARVVIS